jgi:hypothetical protein
MQTRSLAISATLISAFVLALAAVAHAGDPFVGTWKLNVSKSKTYPSMFWETVKNENLDTHVRITFDGMDTNGNTYHSVWSGKYDGRDYAVTGWTLPANITVSEKDVVRGNPSLGWPPWDTCAYKTTDDPNTLVEVNKKDGREVASFLCVISKYGREFVCTGTTVRGRTAAVSVVYVFDKQ